MNETTETTVMDVHEILKYLPHRYPFLLVDKVVSLKPHESIVALKNITINEPFFTGHFPNQPVMPGVLMLEALAQASGILAFKSTNITPSNDDLYFFAGIDKARFKKVVEPGDQLFLHVAVDKVKRDLWKFKAHAMVDNQMAVEAEIMCAKKAGQ